MLTHTQAADRKTTVKIGLIGPIGQVRLVFAQYTSVCWHSIFAQQALSDKSDSSDWSDSASIRSRRSARAPAVPCS